MPWTVMQVELKKSLKLRGFLAILDGSSFFTYSPGPFFVYSPGGLLPKWNSTSLISTPPYRPPPAWVKSADFLSPTVFSEGVKIVPFLSRGVTPGL